MTGYDILTEAARLLGIEHPDEGLKITGLTLINRTLCDMRYLELTSLSEPVGLASPAQRQALIFGTAMLLAMSLGDADTAANMSELYGKGLSALRSGISRVLDTQPKGEW